MIRNLHLALAALGLFGVSLGLLGCERAYPEPEPDAILRSFRNARVQGKLRICWPAGQTYVEAVLKADGKLRAALGNPTPKPAILALPSKDNPAWRESANSDAEEPAGEDGQKQPESRKALDQFTEAVAKLPSGLPDEGPLAGQQFEKAVWDALAVDGVPLREFVEKTEKMRRLRQKLDEKISDCRDSIDKEAAGLRFADADCQASVEAIYDELASLLDAQQESFLDFARRRMAQVHERIGQVDKKKERDEYLYLDNQRTYFKHVLKETWLKGLQDRITAAKDALADHDSGDEPLPPEKVDFLRADLPRLEAAQAELSQRISAILKLPAGR